MNKEKERTLVIGSLLFLDFTLAPLQKKINLLRNNKILSNDKKKYKIGGDIMIDSYMSMKDTAKYLDVSVSTLRKWIKLGMPVHRVGYKLLKFIRPEVEGWLNNECVVLPAEQF